MNELYKELKGKYNSACIFQKYIEKECEDLFLHYLDINISKGLCIRIMPDVHLGNETVIGFTSTLNNYIVPGIIGVDIGCGVTAWNLGRQNIKCDKLDKFIRKNIPAGKDADLTPAIPDLIRLLNHMDTIVQDIACKLIIRYLKNNDLSVQLILDEIDKSRIKKTIKIKDIIKSCTNIIKTGNYSLYITDKMKFDFLGSAKKGNMEKVEYYINNSIDVNARDPYYHKKYALLAASENGHGLC